MNRHANFLNSFANNDSWNGRKNMDRIHTWLADKGESRKKKRDKAFFVQSELV